MLYKSNILTLEPYWHIVDVILMSSDVWAQVTIFTHFNCIWTLCGHCKLVGTGLYFG